MKKRDIIRRLQESAELNPSPKLRDRIMSEALPLQTAPRSEAPAEPARVNPWLRLMPVAAAVVLCILIAGGGVGVYHTEARTVYLDVNPSVELSVNLFDRVIRVSYLNKDASETLKSIQLTNRSAEDALDEILEAWGEGGYLQDAELNISVSSKNTRQGEKLLGRLEDRAVTASESRGYTIEVQGNQVTAEEKEAARDSGLSPVKYGLVQEVLRTDGDYSEEDLREMSMKELRELLEYLSPSVSPTPDHPGDRPSGSPDNRPAERPDGDRNDGSLGDSNRDPQGTPPENSNGNADNHAGGQPGNASGNSEEKKPGGSSENMPNGNSDGVSPVPPMEPNRDSAETDFGLGEENGEKPLPAPNDPQSGEPIGPREEQTTEDRGNPKTAHDDQENSPMK